MAPLGQGAPSAQPRRLATARGVIEKPLALDRFLDSPPSALPRNSQTVGEAAHAHVLLVRTDLLDGLADHGRDAATGQGIKTGQEQLAGEGVVVEGRQDLACRPALALALA